MSEYRKTLADTIRESPHGVGVNPGLDKRLVGPLLDAVGERLETCPVVVADDVAALAFEEAGEHWRVKALEDFPSARPPFDVMWVEMARPNGMQHALSRRWGTLFTTSVIAREQEPLIRHVLPEFTRWLGDSSFVRVVCGSVFGATDDGKRAWLAGSIQFPLNDQGEAFADPYVVNSVSENGDPDEEIDFGHIHAMGVASVFALALMHCKNVEWTENRPPPALSQRHQERHGRPLVRYYTLDIQPMRKVLETEGRLAEVGLKRALHLCRGHFKDYRQGAGLFGRNKGLYWWDANVRGTIEKGIVAKDYAVKAPKPEGGEG